jgi:RAMP superfamily
MARHGISRPQGTIERHEPPAHDRWARDLFTGSMSFLLATVPGRFLSPGSGRLGIAGEGAAEIAVQQAARRAGTPVVPGSGIKGAVRTLYELLTFSCDPFTSGCQAQKCCPACSLFGLAGRSGRVSFSDAVPAREGAVQVTVRKVPTPWKPNPAKTGGDFRVYDLRDAAMFDKGRRVWLPRPKALAREVLTGEFTTRMTFWNATPEELGRLLLAMGLGLDEAVRFELRLGGVKYDGQGGVRVTTQEIRLATPRTLTLRGDECAERCARWIRNARETAWGSTFWPVLEDLVSLLQATD